MVNVKLEVMPEIEIKIDSIRIGLAGLSLILMIFIIFFIIIACDGFEISSVSYETDNVEINHKTEITVNNRVAIAIQMYTRIPTFTIIAKAKRNQQDLQVIEREYDVEPFSTINDTLIFNTLISSAQIDFFTYAIHEGN